MATPQHAKHQRRDHLGRILVALGSVALLADLSFLAQPLERLAARLSEGLFALLPSVGLSFLDAARAFALHQIDYFSLISRILVLFSALVALVVGTTLWSRRQASTSSPDRSGVTGSVEGDR